MCKVNTIRETIRTTRLYASPSLKSEYGPELWADKRKAAFGRLRLVNDPAAQSVDSFHMELVEMDPASFSDGLLCLSDMLDEMLEYMQSSSRDDDAAEEFAYRLDRMTAERDELAEERDKLVKERDALESELLDIASTYFRYSFLDSSLMSDLAAAHNEIKDLRKIIWKEAPDRRYLADLAQLQDQLRNCRYDRAIAWQKFHSTKKRPHVAKAADFDLLQELFDAHDEIASLRARLADSLPPDLAALAKERDALTVERDALAAERDALAAKLSALESSAAPAASEPAAQTDEEIASRVKTAAEQLPGVAVTVKGGCYVWISGATKPVAGQLKALGCRWSPKRSAWYWSPACKRVSA